MKVGSLSYTPLAQIGVGLGANSEVWQIDEPQLGGVMVVKEIAKADFAKPAEYFEEAQRVFAASHPNVVPIQYACETPDKVCLVMPYFANGPLTNRIAKGPVTEREVVRVGLDVLAGLSHIHSRSLVHFDVKPSNVLFSDTDAAMVADFGQCRPLGPLGTTRTPGLYPHSFPPEVYDTGVGSPQTDIYHVGLLLYRAVNGDPHYAAQVPSDLTEHRTKTLKGRFPDRQFFMPHVSPRLRTIIRKALKVDPAQRFQTAAEMGATLGRVNVELDWHVSVDSNGTTWTAPRVGQPALVVRLEQDGPGTWQINTYTATAGARRAKDPRKLRRQKLSIKEAQTHLNGVCSPVCDSGLQVSSYDLEALWASG